MPNTKSASKAMRQSRRRNTINLRTKSKFKSAVKVTKQATVAGDSAKAVENLKKAFYKNYSYSQIYICNLFIRDLIRGYKYIQHIL